MNDISKKVGLPGWEGPLLSIESAEELSKQYARLLAVCDEEPGSLANAILLNAFAGQPFRGDFDAVTTDGSKWPLRAEIPLWNSGEVAILFPSKAEHALCFVFYSRNEPTQQEVAEVAKKLLDATTSLLQAVSKQYELVRSTPS